MASGFTTVSITLATCILSLHFGVSLGFGPPYPITAAWFQDRFTASDWNKTLTEYAAVGGDTVLLRAPPVTIVTRDEVAADPEFKWCGSYRSESRVDTFCLDEITAELAAQNITVTMFGTYKYEEGYNETAVMRCPMYDRKVVTSRIYYLLVLPFTEQTDVCDLIGKHVLVLATSFAGVDPHRLLLENAQIHKMSVYFGLPPLPVSSAKQPGPVPVIPYMEFIRRVMLDHKYRYSISTNSTTLYKTLTGYFYSTDIQFAHLVNHVELFKQFRTLARLFGKQLGISTYFETMKYNKNAVASTLDSAESFKTFINMTDVDVFAVRDGRGSGNAGLFWETQEPSVIKTIDPGLYAILKYRYPSIRENATYSEVFTTSVNKMFGELESAQDDLAKVNKTVQLWLTIEAYDYLHNDPCLPVDHAGSGMDQMLNKVSKSRLDYVLTHAGVFVQKVAALAWDPGFTCKTDKMNFPLTSQVKNDRERPIISHCSFHSAFNRSVVIIGYSLLALTQGYTVDWPNVNGHRETSDDVHGYYFELDWGGEHHKVPSLIYTQLYDPYDVIELAPKGYVRVTVHGGYHSCFFKYDFTNMGQSFPTTETPKRYYYKRKVAGKLRIFGQDTPRHNRAGITWDRNRRMLRKSYHKYRRQNSNGVINMRVRRFVNKPWP